MSNVATVIAQHYTQKIDLISTKGDNCMVTFQVLKTRSDFKGSFADITSYHWRDTSLACAARIHCPNTEYRMPFSLFTLKLGSSVPSNCLVTMLLVPAHCCGPLFYLVLAARCPGTVTADAEDVLIDHQSMRDR